MTWQDKDRLAVVWQGRDVALTIEGESTPINSLKGVKIERKPIEINTVENGWPAFSGEFDGWALKIQRVMKTKGKQPRAIAVWKKL